MTYEEFMALECPSGSEDELDFDDSDGDPTINVNDLDSADSDREPEATAVNTHNSNNYCLKDDENEAVSDAKRYFESLMGTLHFNDNTKRPDPETQDHDKLYKIRPIIYHVNKKCLLLPMSERLSVDEQICTTKARHHMKVYMKDKSHKWGYKLFVLCGDMGFAHKIEIYSGQENNPKFRLDNEPHIGASGNVVIRLIREVPRYQNYKFYFDRYYTSMDLVVYLFKFGIQSVGIIQRNRITNCKFQSENELKKEEYGYFGEYITSVDNVDVSSVLYEDNNIVCFLSTFVGELPKSEVTRFDRKKREHRMVQCPAVVSVYNSHMGNVDLLDSIIGRCHIKIRPKC
ncbi:piggyBac transposable element-derived protein 3-like [Schistocerca gregaria]|uniref:piggyBac transposable element-derived protein 3-like n=1 Tax=Schistocerca gregaria TaxID=7010 RepID=UPI00211E105B|nr:piggyBac transposable element-derived protein 3-like [Schistocerca gregaria]